MTRISYCSKALPVVILFLLTACIFEPDKEDPLGRRLDALEPLAVIQENLVFHGFSPLPSIFDDQDIHIIRGIINDQATWEEIWILTHSPSAMPPLPPVDFEVNSVVVLIAPSPQLPTPRAELDSLVIHEKGIRGYDVVIMPPPGSIGLPVVTNSTALVLVPKVAGVTEWRKRRA